MAATEDANFTDPPLNAGTRGVVILGDWPQTVADA